MRPAIRVAVLALMSVPVVAACDGAPGDLATAKPASGAQLQEFSRQWNEEMSLASAAPLLQKYCMNMSGAACAPDTAQRLQQYGFADGGPMADLGFAVVKMAADAKDGVADQKASDEDFVASCYKVILGREPDMGGFTHHVASLAGQGEEARRALALAFLRSPEFSAQK